MFMSSTENDLYSKRPARDLLGETDEREREGKQVRLEVGPGTVS